MSLLSTFIVNHIVNALEQEFLSHEPQLQQEFLNELSLSVKVLSTWIKSKIINQGEKSDEKKGS